MLKRLRLKGVGEMPDGEYAFGRRFNVFTGDNGLGKTFMLDLIWYALTRRWPNDVNPQLMYGYMARPSENSGRHEIRFDLDTAANRTIEDYKVEFKFKQQAWVGKPGRPYSSGLVVYAHVDGGFSVWDPARNYWIKRGNIDAQEREPAFVFSNYEVWNGQYKHVDGADGAKKTVCTIQGLLADISLWQSDQRSKEYPILKELIKAISPGSFMLKFGALKKLSLDDVRLIPSVDIGYGEVPAPWASSAIKRILALAYMLVWSFSEHIKSAQFMRMKPTRQVTLLFDELDAHLHPKWQSVIMPALSKCVSQMMKSFTEDDIDCEVQVVASTHSPVVMASLEDIFDVSKDKWYDFDFSAEQRIKISDRDFMIRGTVDNWLMSQAFDMPTTYSPGVGRLVSEAESLLDATDMDVSMASQTRLRELLEALGRRLPPGDELVYRLDQLLKDRRP